MLNSIKVILLTSMLGLAAPVVAQSEEASESAASSKSGTAPGLFGNLRLGPTVSLAIPYLGTAGLDAKWDNQFGLAFSVGKLKRDFKDDISVEVLSWDARVRWFPWQGNFFLGAAYGNMEVTGQAKKDLKVKQSGMNLVVPTTLQVKVETSYLTPHLGWIATWDSGFTLGFELGCHLPIGAKANLETAFENVASASENDLKESKEYKDAKKDIEDTTEAFGKTTIPYINLIRIGWMF